VQGASSSTGTLEEEGPWEGLPEELILKVLDELRCKRRDSGAVRGTCRKLRAIHDASRKTLVVRDGVTDAVMHALCGRLPALTTLQLRWVKSLTAEGFFAVGGLTALTHLYLHLCANVTDEVLRELRELTGLTALHLSNATTMTDVGLRELRELTALTELNLGGCSSVTDVGLQELTYLTALTELNLSFCSTSKLGRDALKAAIPGLAISC
jgi:hypothetical protein